MMASEENVPIDVGLKGLTLSLPESIRETCNVVLTFESVDKIL